MVSLLTYAGLYHKIPKEDLEKLAHFEICHFLQKIYIILKGRYKLKPAYPEYVRISLWSIFSPYSWKIRLNSEEEIKKGNVGEITMRSDWAFSKKMRKKAAAFIAAEWYLYHLYANEGKLNQIYRPVVHGLSVRPALVIHILKLIGEEK